ncbi:NTE family protein [Pseudomonas duriflava]|uniref:NTE family protein n=1 Tax=Pseudomonas duriflava TaxID=459528 RepID=A0A562Q1D5_9PSED|nr:patatin-like phospholipase family protein [Pseudomonas duriflava]TWI50474.1 NTE family protein [Pseudomonas duriflava]
MRCIIFCLLILISTASLGENTHPKVGLVLSGGAARGLAHIGVLKGLEEQGVHIDAIAGTSMGAVIGGLYAAGYKADEIERIALDMDWQQVLSDQPPRKDIPFRRKQDDRDYLIKQPLSIRDDGTIGLPIGVIQGQNLSMLLERLLVHTSNTRNFDKLAIPFRAVATDIATGEKIVFSKGHLPRAIRASMAIPAVFAPVEINGRLLVDGGMVDNIPIDVARSMGVDRVIVIDIGTPLLKRKQLVTVVDILNQSTTLMTRNNSEAQLATLQVDDILIQPPLAAYDSTAFGNATELIDAGYRATQALQSRLAELGTSYTNPSATTLTEARLPGQRTPLITNITIQNDSKISDDVIRRYIRQPLNEPLDLERLQDDMSTLYGLNYFDRVEYSITRSKENTKSNTLVIHAIDKLSGTDFLRFGINLSDDMRGDSAFNLGASYRVNGINALGAEWLTRGQVGDHQELYSEFYQPLDIGSRYFVAPYFTIDSQNIETLVDNDPVAEYRRERYGYGINLGRQINNSGEIRFGIGQRWGKTEVRVGDPSLPTDSFNEGFYELKYSYDTLDNVDFPHEGEDIQLSFRQFDPSLGSDDRYQQFEFKIDKALTFGPDTFVLGGSYGRTYNDVDTVTSSYLLGGARHLSGYREDALSGQNYSLGRLVYYRRMTERSFLPLDFPIYLGASLEQGRVWNNNGDHYDSGSITAGSVFVSFDTPLGPLNFSYGLNDDRQKALYLNLGNNF